MRPKNDRSTDPRAASTDRAIVAPRSSSESRVPEEAFDPNRFGKHEFAPGERERLMNATLPMEPTERLMNTPPLPLGREPSAVTEAIAPFRNGSSETPAVTGAATPEAHPAEPGATFPGRSATEEASAGLPTSTRRIRRRPQSRTRNVVLVFAFLAVGAGAIAAWFASGTGERREQSTDRPPIAPPDTSNVAATVGRTEDPAVPASPSITGIAPTERSVELAAPSADSIARASHSTKAEVAAEHAGAVNPAARLDHARDGTPSVIASARGAPVTSVGSGLDRPGAKVSREGAASPKPTPSSAPPAHMTLQRLFPHEEDSP